MNFDLRTHGSGLPRTPFLIVLNDRIIRRVVAFDTQAGTVERLAGAGNDVIVLAHVGEAYRKDYGDFRGLATVTEHGQVDAWGKIESQDDLDAQAGRWA
jgi:hypothetical protein